MRVYLAPGILLVLQGEDCAFEFGTVGVLDLQHGGPGGRGRFSGSLRRLRPRDNAVSVNVCQVIVRLFVVCLFLLKSKSRGKKI